MTIQLDILGCTTEWFYTFLGLLESPGWTVLRESSWPVNDYGYYFAINEICQGEERSDKLHWWVGYGGRWKCKMSQ